MYPVLHWEIITHCSYKPENTHLSLDSVSHLIFIHENYCEEKNVETDKLETPLGDWGEAREQLSQVHKDAWSPDGLWFKI